MADPYIDVEDFKSRADIGDSKDDKEIEGAILAASRRIDTYCGRTFYQTGTTLSPATRTFTANRGDLLDPVDIASTTGLVIKSDTSGDLTYATTWAGTDYALERDRGAYDTSLYPYTRIRTATNGRYAFPTWADGVQITAVFGWPAVPEEVVQACYILATRYFKRKDAPFAQFGSPELGVVSITASDPDVAALLDPFRAFSGLA